ncbi:4-hydroxy-tetrahydrodipicolinate reductase [Myxococcota bacterium]|nr:4-hydroxy-tetrahydrodipicolinate reductase [Myxococcota bacterium]
MTAKQHVLVTGALGRMGERVRALLDSEPSLELAAALEAPGHPSIGQEIAPGIRLEDNPATALEGCDVAIDFSVPDATLTNLDWAARAGVAYVTGTTGLDEAGRNALVGHAEHIPILHAPNFSVAVNALIWLTQQAAQKLGEGFDAELVEMHHSAKRDAPSGTALRLAQAVADGRGIDLEENLVLERAGDIGARPEGAIGVQSLRAGDCPGEHTVLFVGGGERLELTHRAATRDHFARGAVRAAAWLVGREPGLYTIEQMLGF